MLVANSYRNGVNFSTWVKGVYVSNNKWLNSHSFHSESLVKTDFLVHQAEPCKYSQHLLRKFKWLYSSSQSIQWYNKCLCYESLKDLLTIYNKLEAGNFVFVIFKANSFEWRKGVNRANCDASVGSHSKHKPEGFTTWLGFNSLNGVIIESAKCLLEDEPVDDDEGEGELIQCNLSSIE